MSKGKRISYETKVAICADYLIGMPMGVMAHKYGGSAYNVTKWIRARGCFKLRIKKTKNK